MQGATAPFWYNRLEDCPIMVHSTKFFSIFAFVGENNDAAYKIEFKLNGINSNLLNLEKTIFTQQNHIQNYVSSIIRARKEEKEN